MSVDYALCMAYLKQTQLLCVICTVSKQPACPCLSCMVNSCHACLFSGFTQTLRSAVAFTDATAGWAYCMHETTRGSRTFGLHEVFKCGHLKFTVYGHKQVHTTSTNAVMPVWASLRLAPMKYRAIYTSFFLTQYTHPQSSKSHSNTGPTSDN